MEDNQLPSELTQRISKGIDLGFAKLVREKALTDSELIFFEHGKIIYIKARDLLKEIENNSSE